MNLQENKKSNDPLFDWKKKENVLYSNQRSINVMNIWR